MFIFVLILSVAVSGCETEQLANPTIPIETATFISTSAPTRTSTPPYTQTAEASPTPTLGIGSTQVSPQDGMVLLYVPEGNFVMGSDLPNYASADYTTPGFPAMINTAHTVWLDPFWIDQTEVTNGMYQKCVASGFCSPSFGSNQSKFNGSEQPVVSVTWYQAEEYCMWAGRRLPTEAEWEKTARGTEEFPYPWGDEGEVDPSKANYLWIEKDGMGKYIGRTTDVGSYPAGASPYGALDMAGNVYEWVADWFSPTYYQESPARNPQGPESGSRLKVLRGGSWKSNVINSIDRYMNYPDLKDPGFHIGFRCAKSP